jgi:hypothetical protein
MQVHGLSQLRNKLDHNLPIHLYFVVPNIFHMFDNYYLQNYTTADKKVYRGWDKNTAWIRDNVIQYVLLIDWSEF